MNKKKIKNVWLLRTGNFNESVKTINKVMNLQKTPEQRTPNQLLKWIQRLKLSTKFVRAITELTSDCPDIFDTMLNYQHFQRELVGRVNSAETGCITCVKGIYCFLLEYFVVIIGKTTASQHSHTLKRMQFLTTSAFMMIQKCSYLP